MRRTLLIGATMLLAPAGGAMAAASPQAPAAPKPPLAAKLTACTTGLQPASRAATFGASMPALKGTRRMSMRFRLLQRRGTNGAYKAVDVPEWAGVERSDPGRPGFIFTKRVEGLLAPASYKAVVRFRWYDRKGRLQRETSRTTAACRQPDQRPDLRLTALIARLRDKSTATYELTIRNAGRTVADPFGVVLTVGGQDQPAVTLGPLAPDTPEKATIVAPRCEKGDMLGISVDSAQAIDEADETDNVLTWPCPLGGGAVAGGASAAR
jgi:hypothetical protein